ncbi:uncharacterized protein LOC136084778 [Hydra vulgaris]|uniref:Cytochrome c oxidase assembly protein COX20, mitochondrial n=1 Tax=Hydra vulgaris TaxID=6087 RepID=A0ABM4CJ15_HYDVU
MECSKCETGKDAEPVIKNKGSFQQFLKTPSTAQSLIIGIQGGFGLGLIWFFYSKNVKRSCDLAIGSWAVISTLSWFYYTERRVSYTNTMQIVAALEQKKRNANKNKAIEES